MRVSIVGGGYVGLVTAACLAEVGNNVLCCDIDAAKVQRLNAGQSPIYEPGLEELLQRNLREQRLKFTARIEEAVHHAELVFICVGTPPREDGSADLQHVLNVARQIATHMRGFKVIINKSTVPVGTGERVADELRRGLVQRNALHPFTVVSNPEFLKEGAAIDDFLRPDRIVLGTDATPAGQRALRLLKALYAPFQRHHERMLTMDVRSAELTKYAANAMLATRIGFMNELANLAEKIGADIEQVRAGIGSDPRIGYSFLYAGCGYGGSCFPKDVKALIRTAEDVGQNLSVLRAVNHSNQRQKRVLVEKIIQRFGPDLSNMTFAMWGLSFKPETDDMREASSRTIAAELVLRGATVQAFDPVAGEAARQAMRDDLAEFRQDGPLLGHFEVMNSQDDTLLNADALIVCTEWRMFKSPDFLMLSRTLKHKAVFDGRNLYDPALLADYGLVYEGIGRRAEPPGQGLTVEQMRLAS
ncbi:UDP-glucose/GDP-mannose dehydrogenase family protein [Limnobacter sp.]|uniref:UDP-glucose dehydrogenase family protein n=1 Tax=Limnobacter sp. TaxID=2003368 RepID=UPI0035191DC8